MEIIGLFYHLMYTWYLGYVEKKKNGGIKWKIAVSEPCWKQLGVSEPCWEQLQELRLCAERIWSWSISISTVSSHFRKWPFSNSGFNQEVPESSISILLAEWNWIHIICPLGSDIFLWHCCANMVYAFRVDARVLYIINGTEMD